ncbi:arylsulfatase [Pelagicoccus mobilis]|uniref:Arylsulfatase n=1 Tax=Pelagicoccus mobilis TaxID=415221 RepID=A0A934RZU7_9BACT|nr:arylsulfatase [Pelagicoccus mobilis]MBK1879343.1 arylsulfatase [Pelagicoccus mobilis]
MSCNRLLGTSRRLVGLFSFMALSVGFAHAERPNVVLILADDLGYSDLGCYGGEIETPNLDSLAEGGLRFSHFYNTGRCWPSRAVLMTGYHAQQVAMDPVYGKEWPKWTRLLPHHLKGAGYKSYLSGKWHVRHHPNDPVHSGFDRSYRLADHDRFFHPRGHFLDDVKLPAVQLDEGYYATVAITDYALEFLDTHEKQQDEDPFFLYLGYTAPHFPLHALPEDMERFRGRYDAGWDALREERYEKVKALGLTNGPLARRREDVRPRWSKPEEQLQAELHPQEVGRGVAWDTLTDKQKAFQAKKMEAHAAMVYRMDLEIGRILESLRSTDELDNTVILFMSDNGATAEQMIRGDKVPPGAEPGSPQSFLALGPGWSTAANTPLSLHKHWTHEGGIASPMIVNWPERIEKPGTFSNEPSHLIDIVPTILDLAGADPIMKHNGLNAPEMPGLSLKPLWEGEVDWDERPLYFDHFENRALRLGEWKAVMRRDNGDQWELYRLSEDRGETNDLAAQNPEVLDRLVSQWKSLRREYKVDGLKGRDPDAKVHRLHVDY